MDWVIFWTVTGVAIAAVTLVFGALVYFRQFPKRQLVYRLEVAPMLRARSVELEVRYKGRELSNPYFVQLRVRSRSRADISSSSFDAQKDVVFEFGREMIGYSTAMQERLVLENSPTAVFLKPQKIGPNAWFRVSFVTDGEPDNVRIDNSLLDIKVVAEVEPGRRRWFERLSNPFLPGLIAGVVTLLTVLAVSLAINLLTPG
jgi:hypothetical protein